MGIDISRLSPAAQRQAAEKLAAQRRRIATAPAAPRNDGKYHNQPDERNGIRFDSRKEARRYDELILMLKAGEIRDLRLQPQFTLQEAFTTPEGNRVRAIRYQADFSYQTDAGIIVEDVKSKATKTREYELKRKLLRERSGIEITEVE